MKRVVLFLMVLGLLYVPTVSIAEVSPRTIKKAARLNKKVGIKKICRKISPLTKSLLKNAYPGHISASDPRAPGFAFVCGPDCPRRFPVNAFYSDGSKAFSLGYYGTWEVNHRPRAYCGAGGVGKCYASSVSREARKRGRDGRVYLAYGDGTCRSAIPGLGTAVRFKLNHLN